LKPLEYKVLCRGKDFKFGINDADVITLWNDDLEAIDSTGTKFFDATSTGVKKNPCSGAMRITEEGFTWARNNLEGGETGWRSSSAATPGAKNEFKDTDPAVGAEPAEKEPEMSIIEKITTILDNASNRVLKESL